MVSVPTERGAKPADTLTAEPEDEPPGFCQERTGQRALKSAWEETLRCALRPSRRRGIRLGRTQTDPARLLPTKQMEFPRTCE